MNVHWFREVVTRSECCQCRGPWLILPVGGKYPLEEGYPVQEDVTRVHLWIEVTQLRMFTCPCSLIYVPIKPCLPYDAHSHLLAPAHLARQPTLITLLGYSYFAWPTKNCTPHWILPHGNTTVTRAGSCYLGLQLLDLLLLPNTRKNC